MFAPGAREVVIVDAVRTPIGRGHREKGVFRDVHPADLLGRTLRGLLDRTGVAAESIDHVIGGCVQQYAEQTLNVTRTAWLQAGLPETTAATTVDYQCGSSQQAIAFGASMVASGLHDVVIGCGVEHMGRVSFAVAEEIQARYGRAFTPELLALHPIENQGAGAEMIADRWNLNRQDLDELAVRSHRLAHEASTSGAFTREILPVETAEGTVTADQGIRPGTDLESLGKLRPVFRTDGRVTAGNASQISDGAAAVLIMTREKAAELGLTPRARIVDHVVVGSDPVTMLLGPMPATEQILARTGRTIADLDRVEVNEAFAPVVGAWVREFDADLDRVNRRGGAMALGHPMGSSGARLITTLLGTLEDDDLETGLVTMCCGGGLGIATLLQRI